MMKKNIFVIGDLVVDHAIFVSKEPTRPHEKMAGMNIDEAFRQQTTAGGAANTARILAVVNPGDTFLWGIISDSDWGSFRSILEASQDMDEAQRQIKLLGIHDETNAKIYTNMRIIAIDLTTQELTHKNRVDNLSVIYIPNCKRDVAISDLKKLYESHHGIDAIIINDLDTLCITDETVNAIAKFADEKNIPLFIDPKRTRAKYEKIKATAILPNLYEWCWLVDQKDKDPEWKQKLNKSDPSKSLIEMAQLSMQFLSNFKYHIIKCDVNGAVVITPHPDPEKAKHCAVYKIPSNLTPAQTPHQLGCGDVFVGIFALEYDKSSENVKDVLKALNKANAVVHCYREQPWHRMPTLRMINGLPYKDEDSSWMATPIAVLLKGAMLLPKERKIDFNNKEYKTGVPNIYTRSPEFQKKIELLLTKTQKDWLPDNKPRSIILGAPSGCGKTTIKDYIKEVFPDKYNINVKEITDDVHGEKFSKETLNKYLKGLKDKGGEKLLLLVDETLASEKYLNKKKLCVNMLNEAEDLNTKFVFFDTGFHTAPKVKHPLGEEVHNRCTEINLLSLEDRLSDIPIIIGGMFFRKDVVGSNKYKETVSRVYIESRSLLAITNYILNKSPLSPRDAKERVQAVYEAAIESSETTESLSIKFEHVPDDTKVFVANFTPRFQEYEFIRETSNLL